MVDAGVQARPGCSRQMVTSGRAGAASWTAGASRAAAAVRTVAHARRPLVITDPTPPPRLQPGSRTEHVRVDIWVARRVKLGDELGAPHGERSLPGHGSRTALPLAPAGALRTPIPNDRENTRARH